MLYIYYHRTISIDLHRGLLDPRVHPGGVPAEVATGTPGQHPAADGLFLGVGWLVTYIYIQYYMYYIS